jgi:hypothetical protein
MEESHKVDLPPEGGSAARQAILSRRIAAEAGQKGVSSLFKRGQFAFRYHSASRMRQVRRSFLSVIN